MKRIDRLLWFILAYLLAALLAIEIVACDKEEAEAFIDTAARELGPRVVDALLKTYNDPAVVEAYQADGFEGITDVGAGVLLANLKNQAIELSWGDATEQRIYEWLVDNQPTIARMVYDETEQGPQGIWPRLDALARQQGLQGASLHLIVTLTPEQIDWLLQRAPRVIVEEYERVTGQPIAESLLEGIETGGDE